MSDTTLAAPPPATEPPAARPNPYVGPRSFKTGEKMYGREREALDLLDLLIAERIVLLFSPSGAGKSSLIQAELLPRLAEDGFHVLPLIRISMEPPSAGEGIVVANRYVFSALLSLEEGQPPSQQIPLAELATMELGDYLKRRPRPADAPESDVLIFDQFEEILTIDPSNQAAKNAFFTQVGVALRDRRRWALFAMREDYVASLDPYLRPLPTRLKTTFRLDLLGEAAARLAMQSPAREAGVNFSDVAAHKLADDLRRVRVQQTEGQMEEQIGLYVEPVQLQVVCHRLWNGLAPDDTQIDEDDVAAVGDVDSALAGYYEDRIKATATATSVRERLIRDWFETQLITEQGIRGQVLQGRGQSEGMENRVIFELVDAHLVRSEKRRGATWFELAHDRLIDPVRKSNAAWREANLSPLQRQAALWENQDHAEGLLLRDAALDDAQRWASAHQEDLTEVDHRFLDASRKVHDLIRRARRKNRIIRWLAVGATALFAISTVTTILAYRAGQRAREQTRIAVERQLVAQAGELLNTNPQRSLLLALEALSVGRQEGPALGVEAEDTLRRLLVSTGGRVLHSADKPISIVAISPDNHWLVAADAEKSAYLWDLRADPPAQPVALAGHEQPIQDLAFSPDSRWLATASRDTTVRLWDLLAPNPSAAQMSLSGRGGVARALAFSPDGRRLAASSGKDIRVWDVASPSPAVQPLVLAGHTSTVNALAFSPDSRWLASGSADTTARLWDLAAQDPAAGARVLRGHTDSIQKVAFSPDGRWLASGSADTTARVWRLDGSNAPTAAYTLKGHDEPVLALGFTPDSQRLVTGSADTTARIWKLSSPDPSAEQIVLRGHNDQIFAIAISVDGHWLVTGSRDATARLWNLYDDHPEATALTLRGHEDEVRAVAISRDGHWLVTGSGDSTVRLWGLGGSDSDAAPQVLYGHTSVVRAVPFSPDGRWLVTGSGDGTARLWDLRAPDPSARPIVLRGHQNAIRAIAFSPNSRWLASGGDDNKVRLWDLASPNPAAGALLLEGHTRSVRAIAFSPDGRWLATAGADATLRLWDMSGAAPPASATATLSKHTAQIRVIAFSPDSRWLASGGDDSIVRLWDLQSANPAAAPFELKGHTGAVRTLAFSNAAPTRWLVSGGDDAKPRLWDITAQDPSKKPIVLYPHRGVIRAAEFSPDDHWLVTASADRTARLWNMRISPSAQLPYTTLAGHDDEIRAIAISDDSQALVTASEDGTARLWSLSAANPNNESIVFAGHSGPIWAVAISPDGRRVATGSQDATARLWRRTSRDDITKLACRIAGRNLSGDEWRNYLGEEVPYRRTCTGWPSGAGAPEDAPVTP